MTKTEALIGVTLSDLVSKPITRETLEAIMRHNGCTPHRWKKGYDLLILHSRELNPQWSGPLLTITYFKTPHALVVGTEQIFLPSRI